jgi:hypothetical protein
VLTSTFLYLIVSEFFCDLGNLTCKLNLKNYIYNYNVYILNLVGRSFGKCLRNSLVFGGSLRFKISSFFVYAEALAILVAITADIAFNRRNLETLLYYYIQHIPWCFRYYAQSLRLEAFEDFYVRRGCGSTELYSVGPDWFEYSFVDEEFVVYREF